MSLRFVRGRECPPSPAKEGSEASKPESEMLILSSERTPQLM